MAGHGRARGAARPPLRHRVAAAGVSGAAALLARMPALLAYALADLAAAGIAGGSLIHERRIAPRGRGMFRTQRIAYREQWSRRLALRLLLGWSRHLAWSAVDFCRMTRIAAHNLERYVETADLDGLRALLDEGNGLICVTGHIGVWELASHAVSLYGLPITVVARPLAMAPLERRVTRLRSSGGVEVLGKWRVLLPLLRALRRGRVVGFLVDEDTPNDPIFAPFLGTPAATNCTAALLQRHTGAPIAVVSCHRLERERYRFRVWRIIRHAPSGDATADARSTTAAINEALSEAILAHPEQWLWNSRRFHTRPPGEMPGPDGLPPIGTHSALR